MRAQFYAHAFIHQYSVSQKAPSGAYGLPFGGDAWVHCTFCNGPVRDQCQSRTLVLNLSSPWGSLFSQLGLSGLNCVVVRALTAWPRQWIAFCTEFSTYIGDIRHCNSEGGGLDDNFLKKRTGEGSEDPFCIGRVAVREAEQPFMYRVFGAPFLLHGDTDEYCVRVNT